ncbi:MAG: PH domain-containing protein [Balneola sp.]
MSEFRRQHWAAAVDRLFTAIRQNFVTFLILIFVGSRQAGGDYFVYVLTATIVLTFFSGIGSWYRFRYRVFEGELQIKKGIFIRKNVYMSKDRIQVIDVTEGLIQRIFGLVKVEIKTAGGGTESATINAITFDEAEELKRELRTKIKVDTENAGVLEGEESHVQEDEFLDEWRITNKELVIAAFTSGNFGLIASILGALSGQIDAVITDETIEYLKEALPGLNNVTLIVTVVVVILFISWTLSFLGVIFSYSDFSVKKTEKELLIRSGLIERKHITIPFDRIQAIRFVEGLLRQPLGCGMLYVESAGFEQNVKDRSIVLVPFMSRSNMHDFFDRFLSDFHIPELDVKPPKRSFFRYLRRPNYILLLAIPFAWYFWEMGWLLLLLLIPATLIGWLRYKDAGLYFDANMIAMQIRNLNRKTVFIRRKRIQVVDESTNPFQVRKALASLSVTAASGAKGIEFSITDLDKSDVSTIRNWLLSGVKDR